MNELDLFVAAVAIPDPAGRAAFLDRECGADPALRRRLEALLAGHERSRNPLDPPPAAVPAAEATVSAADFAATRDPDGTKSVPLPTEAVAASV